MEKLPKKSKILSMAQVVKFFADKASIKNYKDIKPYYYDAIISIAYLYDRGEELTLDVLEVINNSIISTYEKASNKGECTHMNENKAFTLKKIGEEEYKCLKCGKIMHEDELSDLPAMIKLEEDLHNNPPFSAYSRMTNHAIPGMSGPIPYSVYQQQNPNIGYKQPIPSYQVPYLYGKDYDDDKGE